MAAVMHHHSITPEQPPLHPDHTPSILDYDIHKDQNSASRNLGSGPLLRTAVTSPITIASTCILHVLLVGNNDTASSCISHYVVGRQQLYYYSTQIQLE